MKKKVLSLCMTICLTQLSFAQVSWQWAHPVNGKGTNRGQAIATDAQGNVYSTGVFKDTAMFGTIQLISNGNSPDVYISKYDKAGNILWVKSAGGSATLGDAGYGID